MTVALGLVVAVLHNLGYVVQKRALGGLPPVEARRPVSLLLTLAASPGWLAGFALIGAGLAGQTVVLAHLPLSVAQPLQASGVVVTVVLSRLLLGERPRRAELACLYVIGAAVALLALSRGGPAATSANLPALAAVGLPTCLLALALYAWARTGAAYGLCTGLLYGVAGLALKGLSTELDGRAWHLWPSIALTSPYAWSVVVCSAAGLVIFQSALQRFAASIVVPVSHLTGIGYTVLAGTLLYQEALPSDPWRLGLRVTGAVAAVAAAVALSHAASEEGRLRSRVTEVRAA
ncbi:MAG TPA: hypothetical protein VHJ17_26330 [Thermomonospora sp.]|nr:hypothetical protein [Thermomonospora sp.]